MDSSGQFQWKNRGSLDYTFSWSAIDYFYNYYTQLDGSGMVLVENLNLYLAEPGDIIFLDQKERSNYYAPHVMTNTISLYPHVHTYLRT